MPTDKVTWKAVITVILVVIGWLMYQFTVDVSDSNARVSELTKIHYTDMKAVMDEFSDIGADETIMLEKLAANEESHKNIKDRLDRIDTKLDKIYHMLIVKQK